MNAFPLVAGALLVSIHALLPTTAWADTVAVPGTHVAMVPPPGFSKADLFPGFLKADEASIMVTEMPQAPYDRISAAMTKAGLLTRGMTLLTRQDVRYGDRAGLLLAVSQTSKGVELLKWMGILGGADSTVLVVASYAKVLAKELGEPLRASVLSARWSGGAAPGHYDGLTFRVVESASLKIASRMASHLLLTLAGRKGPVKPEDPMLVVGSAFDTVHLSDLRGFAEARIAKTAQVKDVRTVSGSRVNVGGLPAYEIQATARHLKNEQPLALYQLIISSPDTYYIAVGMVGEANAKKYLPEMRQVARSLTVDPTLR
jgi:hypothetical protein